TYGWRLSPCSSTGIMSWPLISSGMLSIVSIVGQSGLMPAVSIIMAGFRLTPIHPLVGLVFRDSAKKVAKPVSTNSCTIKLSPLALVHRYFLNKDRIHG